MKLDPDFHAARRLTPWTGPVLSELNPNSVGFDSAGSAARANPHVWECEPRVGVLDFWALLLFLFIANSLAHHRQEEPLVNYI